LAGFHPFIGNDSVDKGRMLKPTQNRAPPILASYTHDKRVVHALLGSIRERMRFHCRYLASVKNTVYCGIDDSFSRHNFSYKW